MGKPETDRTRHYGGQSHEHRVAERRAKLMHAAAALYARLGPAGASVTAICAEAGLTPRYFYESFPNREALLLAVFRRACDRLLFEVGEGIDPADPVRSGLATFFAILVEHPQLARVFLVDIDQDQPEMRVAGRAMLDGLASLVMPGVMDGLAKIGAMGAVLRMAKLWVEGGEAEPVDQLVDLGCRFVRAAM